MGTKELPEGWVWTRLGEIMTLEYGRGLPKRKREPGDVPVYGSNGIVGYHSTPLITKSCLIIGRKGSAGAVHISKAPFWPIDTTYYIESGEELDLNFLFYLLSTLRLDSLDKSTAIPGLNRNDAYSIEIPLPPLPEQHCIVTKIEELFTRLDAGVDALKKVKAELKRYRQSVLKAAMEGKLTEEWREIHKGEVEPASVLLERIKEERKKKLGEKYKEPAPVDTGGLPELPEGWDWASVELLAANEPYSITDGPFGSNLKTSHYTGSGPRVIRLQNIGDGEFIDEKAHISKNHFETLRKYEIHQGELVIAALGVDLPHACIIPGYVGPAIVKADCIRFKPHHDFVDRKYVNAALNAEYLKKFAKKIIHGVGRPRLNQKQIKSLPLPLPYQLEQLKIVEEIESRLSVTDNMGKVVEQSLRRAERLRQSILKKAFKGNLVPQDSSDEPASVLLERIKAEREPEAKAKKRSQRKKRKVNKPVKAKLG